MEKALAQDTKVSKEILFPGHPRWVEFMVLLTSSAYLDFHHPMPNDVHLSSYEHKNGLAWYCSDGGHPKNKPFARKVIEDEMIGIDVVATLAQWPGLCDCDLVFKLGDEEEE